jgi:flavin-dependent dehydrogenase
MVKSVFSQQIETEPQSDSPSIRLEDGARVAVVGGGPTGSFFSFFLLDMAERMGMDLKVDIYESRDFSLPAPRGCNKCAGVISESLVQNLAMEGINLPPSVVRRGVNSYVLHTDMGSVRLETPLHEKRIGAMYRGAGPRGIKEFKWESFDGHLLSLAEKKGARVINTRVKDVERTHGRLLVKAHTKSSKVYDLLAVATGVNSTAHKMFESQDLEFRSPQTTKTAIREYFLGAEAIDKYMGSSLHVFLLDIPRLEFAMTVPKGDYVTVCLLGHDIDANLLETCLNAPEVKQCFPPAWKWDQPACQCLPRINVRGAIQPYGDRIVFVGDIGTSRLYKDGIGAAYKAAKAAASTAIFWGISAQDFKRHYWPACNTMKYDNKFGRLIFAVTRLIQRTRPARRAVLRMAAREQHKENSVRRMSSVLWDTFTGSAPYQDIFLRTLHPAFLSRLAWDLAASLMAKNSIFTKFAKEKNDDIRRFGQNISG